MFALCRRARVQSTSRVHLSFRALRQFRVTRMRETVKEKIERDGYAILEQFLLPIECDELVAAGAEFTREFNLDDAKSIFTTKQQIKDEYFLQSNDKIRYFYEEDALDKDGNLKVDRRLALNKVGHALHLLHPIFRCYSYSDRVKAVCRGLCLKEPAIVQSMYIYKNPGTGGEVVAHQDATYLHTEPVPPLGFWIALEDATVENGCLWISPGSHTSGVHRRLKRIGDTLDYDKPPSFYLQSSFRPIEVAKGTLVLLHGQVVHKSAANTSYTFRPAYTFHVIEKHDNTFFPDNWLQEGPEAPFVPLYTTKQME